MRKKGFTLIELLVVIAIIAMLLAILMPALNKVKQMAMRVICGTNMKGLGTAHMVYSGDYEDQYCVQGGRGAHQWAQDTQGWQNSSMNWEDSSRTETVTVGASLYLLVREADVNPKSFVCPASNQEAYDGLNTNELDLVELWDFGNVIQNQLGPGICVSYAYHMPYGGVQANFGAHRHAASGTSTASFAVMADKNPWFDRKLTKGEGDSDTYMDFVGPLGSYWLPAGTDKFKIQRANSQPHNRDGQNVLFGDGHSEWARESDVGVKHDNIYTIRGGADTVAEQIRRGWAALPYGIDNTLGDSLTNSQDSFLVNDDNTTP